MYLQPISETLNICNKPSPKRPKEQANDSQTQPSNHKLLGSAVKQVEVSITSSSIPLVPPTPPKVIPPKPKVPNPFLERASDLSRSIQLLLRSNKSKLTDPELRFDIAPEAARSNLSALQQHEYNLSKAWSKFRFEEH